MVSTDQSLKKNQEKIQTQCREVCSAPQKYGLESRDDIIRANITAQREKDSKAPHTYQMTKSETLQIKKEHNRGDTQSQFTRL